MKILKKLCQTILCFALVVSTFVGTGITKVSAANPIADDIDNVVNTYIPTVEGYLTGLEALGNTTGEMQELIDSIREYITIINDKINTGTLVDGALDYELEYLEMLIQIFGDVESFGVDFNAFLQELYNNLDKYRLALDELATFDEAIYGLDGVELRRQIDEKKAENVGNQDIIDALDMLFQLIDDAEALEGIINNIIDKINNNNYIDSYGNDYTSILDTVMNQFRSSFISSGNFGTKGDLLDHYNKLTEMFYKYVGLFPEFVGLGMIDYDDFVKSLKSNANLAYLDVNGLSLPVDELNHTINVGKSVTELIVTAIAEDGFADIDIDIPDTLVEGDNIVTVTVTALDGTVKVYTITVIKAGDTIVIPPEEPKDKDPVPPVVPEKTDDIDYTDDQETTDPDDEDDEDKNDDKKDPVKDDDEDDEDNKGLNGLTVLLIIGGIALIGFGIYMLFGDKEDDIPEVKETPKSDSDKSYNNNKPYNNNKSYNNRQNRK